MKAMILAAGKGERMRPLTDHTPKPLLPVGGMPLIEHHIRRLAASGFRELVINVSHLGHQIAEFCADGARWGVSIQLSPEAEPLETAGGIINALPLLGSEPFLLVNGDVCADLPFEQLTAHALADPTGAHLVLVANPPQHPLGDFLLVDDQVAALPEGATGLTYSGIGVYAAPFFEGVPPGKSPLKPLMLRAIANGALTGEHHTGEWIDVGTPERLVALDQRLSR